jgi:hypothetical protein
MGTGSHPCFLCNRLRLLYAAEDYKLDFSTSHHHQSHRLGGSSRIIRATGLVCKSRGAANAAMHMPKGGETNLLLTPFLHGVGGSLGENNYIAPQGAYRD